MLKTRCGATDSGSGGCRKPSGRSASYVGLGPPRVTRTPPGHVPDRAHSRLRLIALVGAAPSPPAHSPPGRRPPWLLLGPLRWSMGGCYTSPTVSLSFRFADRRSQNSKSEQLQLLKTSKSHNQIPNRQSPPSRSLHGYLGKRLATETPPLAQRIKLMVLAET